MSQLGHVMKFIYHLCYSSIRSTICKYSYARVILHNIKEVYIPRPECLISAFTQARVFHNQ